MTPEQKRFATNAKKLLRDIAAHVADGGDTLTHGKVEAKLYERRDKIHPLMRKLGLLEDAASLQLYEQVRAACSTMRADAGATRMRDNDAEIRRLKELEREAYAKLSGYEKELRLMRHGRR
jgi:hypothetical protein